MEQDDREDEIRAHQDGRVYPLGRALRSTFDADNHHTLGSDVTGLMIDLSKVPYEPTTPGAPPAMAERLYRQAVPVTSASPAPGSSRSWMARIGELIGGRRLPS